MDHNKNCIEICGSLGSLADEFQDSAVDAFTYLEETNRNEAKKNYAQFEVPSLSGNLDVGVTRNIPFRTSSLIGMLY